jgi:hypothetical protein
MASSWGLGTPGFGCDIILCIEVLTIELGPVIFHIGLLFVAAFTTTRVRWSGS